MEVDLESETQQGAHEVGGRALGGRAPHPREKGVAPLVLIIRQYFLRTFIFCT